ncbi:MAG: ammonia-forming cytochrome c nitrite reductase subunit c552 [Bryobacteraceae bacterium]
MEQKKSESRSAGRLALLAAITAAAVVGLVSLLVNIIERKQEARRPFFQVVDLDDETGDPALWGRNFPIQYEDYLRTADQVRTRHGGSEAVPRTPTDADPRSVIARSKLEEDLRLKTMWAGYPFAVDFREARGHAYMLVDQQFTRRVLEFKQPGTCLQCHSSSYVAMRKAGGGDVLAGFNILNAKPYAEAAQFVEHPVACIDCHEPSSMRLRITRPAFMEGITAYKASLGIRDYDVNRDASTQEMRSYVCGQCHVEYYFQGEGKRLVYPWSKGLKVEDALAYYDEIGFRDWVHAETGAPVLKAQHPEFEMFSQGVHARSGVACADCHMPYKRVGAFKVSDHHVRSPLLNINRACQSCHNYSEAELLARAESIQDRFMRARDLAMDALVELIDEIKAARASGRSDAELKEARDYQRKAQFYIDFVEAENSMGFHAPGEALRILTESVDFIRKGQLSLLRKR